MIYLILEKKDSKQKELLLVCLFLIFSFGSSKILTQHKYTRLLSSHSQERDDLPPQISLTCFSETLNKKISSSSHKRAEKVSCNRVD